MLLISSSYSAVFASEAAFASLTRAASSFACATRAGFSSLGAFATVCRSVLFGAQVLVGADRGAACGIRLKNTVYVGFVFAACSLGGAENLGVFAEEVNINHISIVPSRPQP